MAYGLDPNLILSLGLRPPTPYQTTQLVDPNVYQGYGGGSMPLFYDMQNAPQPFPTQPLGQPGYDPFAAGPIQPPPTAYPQAPPGFGMGPPLQTPQGPPVSIGNEQTPEEQQPGMDQVPMPNFPHYDPVGMGLTQFGLALMRASGPSPYKQGLLSRIGTAGPEGLNAFTGMSQLNFQNAQKAKELQVLEEGRRAQAMQRQAFTENLKEQLQSKKRMRQLLTALGEAKTPEERRTILAEMYPDEAYKAELKRQGERTVVGEGAKLIGPNGEEIATGNPKTETPHTVEVGVPGQPEMGQVMMFNPKTNAYDIKVGGPKKKQALVSIDTANKEADKEFIQEVRKNYTTLRGAPSTINNIDKAIALIPKAGDFVGKFGEKKLNTIKFFNNNLGTNIKAEEVASAEELRTRLFSQIMDNLKKMDATPSENQQRIMQEGLGSMNTDPGALPRVLGVMREIVVEKVNQHNKDVEGAKANNVKFPYDPTIKLPEAPSAPRKRYNPATGQIETF